MSKRHVWVIERRRVGSRIWSLDDIVRGTPHKRNEWTGLDGATYRYAKYVPPPEKAPK